MISPFLSTLAALLLASSAGHHMLTAQACSTFMINPGPSSPSLGGPNAVSGRTMDFDTALDLATSVAIVPPGSTLSTNLLPEDYEGTVYTEKDYYYTSKYGFLATAGDIWQPELGALLPPELTSDPDKLAAIRQLFIATADGLNEKGLSCATLWDSSLYAVFGDGKDESYASSAYYPTANASDKARPNILALYAICKYILATYDSVESTVAGLNPATTQLVQPKIIEKLPVHIFFPFHVVVMDKDRQVTVLEFDKGLKNGDKYAWHNATEWGVVTNEPHLPEHVANLESFIAKNPIINETIAIVDQYLAENVTIGTLPDMMSPIPGSAASTDRFVRLSLFNRVGAWATMPSAADLYMPPPSMPQLSGNTELMTALQLLPVVHNARGAVYESDPAAPSALPDFVITQVCVCVCVCLRTEARMTGFSALDACFRALRIPACTCARVCLEVRTRELLAEGWLKYAPRSRVLARASPWSAAFMCSEESREADSLIKGNGA